MRNTAAMTNDEIEIAIECNYLSLTKGPTLIQDTESLWTEFDARVADGRIVIY